MSSSPDSFAPPVPRWRSNVRVAVALFDQGIVSVATYVTGVLVSRATPEGFGLYTLVFTLWVLGGEAHNSLISTPQMLRLPHLNQNARRRFNGSLLLHQFGLSAALVSALLVVSLILWAMSRSAAGAHLAPHALVTFLAAVSLGPIALRNFARNSCFAVRDATGALALDLGVSIIQLGAVAMLYAHGDLHRWWLAVVIVAVANLCSALLWLAMVRDRFSPRLRSAWIDLWRNWRISRYIFVSSMLWVAGMYLYPWLIVGIGGERAAGVWGVCFALANLGNPLVMGIQNVMGPAIAHAHADRDATGFRAYVFRSTAIFVALVLPASILMTVFAEFLLTHINGGQYAGNGHVTAILAFTIFLQGLSFPTSRGLFSLNRSGLDMAANVGPLIVLAALGYPLISRYGVTGAAIALVLAQFAGSAIRVVAFFRASRVELKRTDLFITPGTEVASS